MIPEVARYILKQAAGYSIFAPLLLAGCTAVKMFELPKSASDFSRYGHATAVTMFLMLIGFNGFRFARPLFRGERPDLLSKAVNSTSVMLWFLPVTQPNSLMSVAVWVPFWGCVCTLLDILVRTVQPQVAAALAKETESNAVPEAA